MLLTFLGILVLTDLLISDAFSTMENIEESMSDKFKAGIEKLSNNVEEFQQEAREIRRSVKTKVSKKVKSNPEYNRLMKKLISKIQLEATEILLHY